ncbi:MAG TPA: ABC transporter substrate-binding protein [Geobacteraceae bacterium]
MAGDKASKGTEAAGHDEMRLGERIYREGILPSGKPVEAVVKGDITVEGSMFSCQSCHMRGGLGSYEGGVYSPPTNGANLFKPLKFVYKGIVQEQVPPRRPAYTDATLAGVLRYGDDPAGRILNDVMPRYTLEDRDMAILVSYLKSLSAQLSPGVTDAMLHFATVVSEDVKAEEREAMLGPLEKYIDNKNNLVSYFSTRAGFRSRRMAVSMLGSTELALRKMSLSRWTLKGPPETWRAQLEEYYRKEPVFALIGGITSGEWQPVHRFCEDNRIPCLFPYTDYPVISGADWYTMYLSKGYYQEGEGAARYLNGKKELTGGGRIVQLVRSSREGRALAEGFQKTWQGLGNSAPKTIDIEAGKAISAELLDEICAREKPGVLLLWDDDRALTALEILAAKGNRPVMVFVSSTYLGKRMRSIRMPARDFTYITYPYSLPLEPRTSQAPPAMPRKVFKPGTTKIENQNYAIIEVLNMALMKIKGNYYRDHFLDIIDCIMDQEVPLYERLSFGPGQRYASKGCYIVQLSKGDNPELLRKSDWVIH